MTERTGLPEFPDTRTCDPEPQSQFREVCVDLDDYHALRQAAEGLEAKIRHMEKLATPAEFTLEQNQMLRKLLDSAEAKLRQALEEAAKVKADYSELIMWVSRKHPDETRHQTALRYIQQAEQPRDGQADAKSALAAGKDNLKEVK